MTPVVNPQDAAVLTAIVEAGPHTDQCVDGLVHCASTFVRAHHLFPGGTSVEIGTRNGGSALLFLRLLSLVYKHWHPPLLLTCDPYGGKPYAEGLQAEGQPLAQPYWDENYLAMKKLLSPFANHAHFLMSSHEFLAKVPDATYWYQGMECQFGSRTAFVFLDGEHEAESVLTDLNLIFDLWHPGLVVVDNVTMDQKLLPRIEANFVIESKTGNLGTGNWGDRIVVTGRKT